MEILKLQVPIAGNAPGPAPAYVYNQAKTKKALVEITEEIKTLMRGRPKMFIHGTISDTQLKISREAPWQDW